MLIGIEMMFSLEDVSPPIEPSEPIIEIPPIENPFLSNSAKEATYTIITRVKFADGTYIKGTISFTNIIVFSLTNFISNRNEVYTFSIYDLDRIVINKWQPEKVSNNLFLFKPCDYIFYFNDRNLFQRELIQFHSNVEFFNVLNLVSGEKSYNLYSIFYDYWIMGKNGLFRWKNSRGVIFEYNASHPLSNVITEIKFLWE